MSTPEPASAVSAPPCVTPPDAARWFREEVHPHDGQLKNYLRGKFPSVRDVDDVVQESYLRIWKARAARPIESAKAFLFQIAQRLALDTIRKRRNSPADSGCDLAARRVLDTRPSAAEVLLSRELFDQVTDVLATLPEKPRTVLILHKLRGLSHREIAVQLGLTERTAQKYCSEAMDKCAERLRARGIDSFFS